MRKLILQVSLCFFGFCSVAGAENIDPSLRRAIDLYTGVAGKVDEPAAGKTLLQANQDDPLVKVWLARALLLGPSRQKLGLTLDQEKVTKAATEALPEVRRMAEAGSAEALYLVGAAAKTGLGGKPNPEESINWYRRAAALDHTDAIFFLGLAYSERGNGVAEDKTEALQWLEKAAAAGHIWAESYLGSMYLRGDGVRLDGFKAITLIQKAAMKGCAWAQEDFGRAYRNGEGVVKNRATALAWYRKASAQGLTTHPMYLEELEPRVTPEALRQALSEIDGAIEFASGTPAATDSTSSPDTDPNLHLYQRDLQPQIITLNQNSGPGSGLERQMLQRDLQEAVAGKANSQFAVGVAYLEGEGVLQSVPTGISWLQKAARQGHPGAEYMIGELYWTGRESQGLAAAFGGGVTQNVAEAIKWFRKAAEKGHTAAQINLGYAYAAGLGIERDAAKAVEWYRKPAAYHSTAQFNLALAYDEGKGVPQDLNEAMNLYLRAAALENASAQLNAGYAYSTGRGVSKNAKQAVNWYRKSVAQGNGMAAYNLGLAYASGVGVDKDEAASAQWYRQAAAAGITGGNPAAADAGMTFSGQLGLIFNGQWAVEKVEGGYARDLAEFPGTIFPDREILNRRVKLVANAADAIAKAAPTHEEYWTRNGVLLAYLIASSRIYGENTLNGSTAKRYETIDPNKGNARTSDDQTLYVDNSLLERYESFRKRHQGSNLQDFSDHISKANLQDLETFMRKWDSESAIHKQMLANLTKFVQRAVPFE